MKKLLILAVVICSVILLSFTAAANVVSDIDAEIVINDDGSADFYQTWRCNLSEKTEVYYFFPDEGKYKISNFKVADEDKTYTYISDWDTSLSFEGKAGKCGILTYDDGYELCWGITEYGDKTYTISFTIDNLVTAYNDADATYFCLFSKNVNTRPTDVSVKISLANGKELKKGSFDDGVFSQYGNCDIFSLRHSGEDIYEKSCYLRKTTTALESDEHMAFRVYLKKDLITPLTTEKKKAKINSDFLDKYYFSKDTPEKSSSKWYEDEFFLLIFALVISVGGPLALILLWKIFNKLYLSSVTKKPEICKSEPTFGIEGAYLMLKDFELSDDENLLSLMLLDLMNAGVISPIMPDQDDPIPISKGNVKFSINTIASEDTLTDTQKEFYRFLSLSAKEDRILDPWEITIRAQDNFYTIRKIMEKYLSEAEHKINISDIKGSQKLFKGALSYTAKGKQEVRNILGYKKYLTEYSLHNTVNYYGYDQWQTPMRYSVILGESTKIREELEKSYPAENDNITLYALNILFAQQAAKLMYKAIRHSEGNYSSTRYGTVSGHYYRTASYRSSGSYRGGGRGFGGGSFGGGSRGGRSGGGTR